jgi:putative transposase
MKRKIPFISGEYYHVYNRGVEKRDVFLNHPDYAHFLDLVYLCNGERSIVYREIPQADRLTLDVGKPLVSIGAYVLMPNHFHLLIRARDEKGITEFMRKLTTAYTMYFNTLNQRVGPLFQGTFKARHVDSDEYFRYMYAYIHLNPAKIFDADWKRSIQDKLTSEALRQKVTNYPYSSYQSLTGESRYRALLHPDEFPQADYLDIQSLNFFFDP